jgi:hypothetical protein
MGLVRVLDIVCVLSLIQLTKAIVNRPSMLMQLGPFPNNRHIGAGLRGIKPAPRLPEYAIS